MKAKKLFALLLVLAMVLSLAACGNSAPAAPAAGSNAGEGTAESAAADPNAVGNDPYADPYADDPYSDPYKTGDQATQAPAPAAPSAEEYMPEAGENYTVTKTADGWIQIENKDGETLGLSPTSGVKIVEADGYAFKDLNQNGKLDVYEDWRETPENRANDLVAQMQGPEMAAILAHGGWGDFTTDPLTTDDGSYTWPRAAITAFPP